MIAKTPTRINDLRLIYAVYNKIAGYKIGLQICETMKKKLSYSYTTQP